MSCMTSGDSADNQLLPNHSDPLNVVSYCLLQASLGVRKHLFRCNHLHGARLTSGVHYLSCEHLEAKKPGPASYEFAHV